MAMKEKQKEERVIKLQRGIMFESAQNSAVSYNLSIQKCAVPAVTAMAISGDSPEGAIETIFHLLLHTQHTGQGRLYGCAGLSYQQECSKLQYVFHAGRNKASAALPHVHVTHGAPQDP